MRSIFAKLTLWFLAALVPVVGFLPYGPVPYADRDIDIPGMRLPFAFAWTLVLLPLGRIPRVAACAAPVLGAEKARRLLQALHSPQPCSARELARALALPCA